MQFTIKEGDQRIEFDEKNGSIDFIQIDENTYHVIHQNTSYEAKVIEKDFENKTIRIGIQNHQVINSYLLPLLCYYYYYCHPQ